MTAPFRQPPNFDLIARPYRWLEYLTFGRGLERCRFHFLPQLAGRARALVLGDGDGRFLARLLSTNPNLTADAVDTSASMLALLTERCAASSDRLRTHQSGAFAFVQSAAASAHPIYDLVVTHFFLDCLAQSDVDALAATIAPLLAANALWVVSDFSIPSGPMRIPARILVRSLYLGFRIFTGLRPTRLPDHATSLTRSGFVSIASHRSLCGILTTELWRVES